MTWQFATGLFKYNVDPKADEEGRRRYHALRGRTFDEMDESLPSGLRREAEWLFMTCRSPKLLSIMPVVENAKDAPDIYAETDVSHASLWATNGDVRSTNAIGDLGLRAMTNPDTLTTWIPMPLGPEFTVSGAHALAVSESGEGSPESLSFVRLSAERYDFTYDPDLDVITSVSAVMDGEIFAQWRLEILRSL